MKKTLAILIMSSVLFTGSTTAFASTTTDQLVLQLQQQIAALSTQLATLRQAQVAVSSTQQSINSTLGLIGSMNEGMTGEQVKLLQATLANDASIYPEGKITGYYGKLTKEAIKRFQKKHGLSGNGTLSSETIKKLNELLHQSAITEENDNEDNDGKHGKKHFCDSSAEWKQDDSNKGKHRGWDKINLPRCMNIPGHTTTPPPATTTPDTIAPTISAITVGSISSLAGSVTWTTNEAASSKLYIGTTSPVTTAVATWTNTALQTAHTAVLSGLTANTTYYFVIEATDAAGNKTLAAQGSFTTTVTPDIVAPVVSGFSVAPTGSTTATAAFATNESASSRVYYGIVTPLKMTTASSVFNAALVTTHSILLSGLTASTTYYVIAESRDAATNVGTSNESSFTTMQ